MDRKEAIRIIVANECLTREDRELLIYNAWGLDGSDEIFYLLPEDLMSELLDYDEPQEDIMSSKYDELVRLISELSYGQYSNEKLASIVGEILDKQVDVIGDDPILYPCPCCGKKTLWKRGEYDICSCCDWEDDGIEEDNKYSSPNHMTLEQGRRNYLLSGSCFG
jgi:hypothetical protein